MKLRLQRISFANYSDSLMESNIGSFQVESPLLCDVLGKGDKIVQKAVKSWKNPQLKLDLSKM